MRRVVLVAFALLLMTSACHFAARLTATPADAEMVQTVFPLIERLKADDYSFDEMPNCHWLEERRGAFMNDISPDSPCGNFRFQNPNLFDDQATQDFDSLTAAFRAAGVRVNGFGLTLSGSVIQTASFAIGCGDVLVYEPGYGPLEDTEVGPNEKLIDAPLTPDWYEEASEC